MSLLSLLVAVQSRGCTYQQTHSITLHTSEMGTGLQVYCCCT